MRIHHIATSVSGPLRTALFWAPMSFTSLTSITYRSLRSQRKKGLPELRQSLQWISAALACNTFSDN